MMLSLGIVGLPNVGKSTLFNALTRSKQADAQNYPFCTIEPNVGVVEVPDERLSKLAEVSKSKKTIPTAIEFYDIAGLVKGASEGEGLGNKFLSHIRETDAIVQVVRAFEDGNITHVHNKIDPKDDAEVINLELIMADWQTISKRLEKTKKSAKGAALKDAQKELDLLEKLNKQLEDGGPARNLDYTDDEKEILRDLHLLSMKPILYVVNSDEQGTPSNNLVEEGVSQIQVCAKLEAELAELSPEDAVEYMKELGMETSGLDKLITESYKLLDLVTYFTSGEPETRAWTVKRGAKGPEAAGVIHTDFVKGYIKADVCKWEDFVENNGWSGIKESGKLRLEGKEYVVEDGDTIYFHVAT
ncbi:MAG: redox-regulated ATPase YchF [Candidatus Magasanikbacteria bacterium]|nr:redox-regulated ATPase YchF [Candidatus Magasanikbacteria bacterium]MBT4315007.1 redox-regulated ATPase YchF [Candidatus Magasanikbacteria bacterium]MBT4547026.1 redox-regulated ATPase YchF [Candidatus Magasanikbacteria bacterium]MBT6819364.1 redox-regulated ATPase YchF [Candidatus Magasanikbacteria bacterium]